jgi:hypothetical protein
LKEKIDWIKILLFADFQEIIKRNQLLVAVDLSMSSTKDLASKLKLQNQIRFVFL